MTFSSYFNVLWQEPRLHISERFLQELNTTSPDTMIPVNLELVNELWLPNIFIYNLKTFKVVEVLSKHAGLWITTNNDVFYSQATHITFICPMRFDAFPLDTQVNMYAVSIKMQGRGKSGTKVQSAPAILGNLNQSVEFKKKIND